MPHSPNLMAQAWIDAASDLGIRVEHPFQFVTADGASATTRGVYLPDFGSEKGTLLTCRFDSDQVHEAAEATDYFQSALSPHHYEPYRRSVFVAALNDWGSFGGSAAPAGSLAVSVGTGVRHNSPLQADVKRQRPRPSVASASPPLWSNAVPLASRG